jgi:hypothetical protein
LLTLAERKKIGDLIIWPFQFSPPSIHGLAAGSQVLEIWLGEFMGYFKDGGCFTLTMHPQVIGRSHRMQMLETLVQHMKDQTGVWFARCKEVAKYWATNK